MALVELIAALAPGEASLLADRLASGELKPWATDAFKLKMLGLSPELAVPLKTMAQAGWQPAQMVEALGLVGVQASPVEVVSTQPSGASKLLAGTAYSLKELLLSAKTSVLIAGYSISQREILEPLVRHAGAELEIELFVNIDPPKYEEIKSVTAWTQGWWHHFLEKTWPIGLAAPTAWYAPMQVVPEADAKYRKMHVKTVIVDDETWFVSSANFSYHGHHQNFELGAKVLDAVACAQVRTHFEAMCGGGVFERLVNPKT
jgi:hypothetical protein